MNIRNIFKLLTLTCLSGGLASCITPPSYSGNWQDFVGRDYDLCAERSQQTLERRNLVSLPYYFVSSRLPDCTFGKIRMTLQRTDKIRYGRFDAPAELRTFEKEKILAQKSDTIVQNYEIWFRQVAAHAAAQDGRVILYTHGYNETYLETASRIARIQSVTDFKGPIIQYSWPSHRKVLRYATDATNVAFNKPQYAKLVHQLAALPEVKNLILVSHSLGSQLLLHGLQEIDVKSKKLGLEDYSKKITNVVLASPDVDKQIFETIASKHILTTEKVRNGRRITIYASAKDKAIRLSHVINGYERLGGTRCDDPSTSLDADLAAIDRKAKARCYAILPDSMSKDRRNGLHIIDTSEVSNSNNGHSDFVISPEACSDFMFVIGEAPLQKASLLKERRRSIGKENIWRLNSGNFDETCLTS